MGAIRGAGLEWQAQRAAYEAYQRGNPCPLDSWVTPTYYIMGANGLPCGKLSFSGANGKIWRVPLEAEDIEVYERAQNTLANQ